MKKNTPLKDDLNLPDAPDFISRPPIYSLEEINKLNEKMLRHWKEIKYSKPEEESIPAPFKLID